ncbi:MAG: hypothetical protein PF495_07680 [Spirochaetales bacterium]|jgi:hypothetical protein|nr:hypothetical protein [Spirochaetales bacterium]
MYHLVIENFGVKRCIATREKDDFKDGMYMDCTQDLGCIPVNFVREISISCAGNEIVKIKAGIYSDIVK